MSNNENLSKNELILKLKEIYTSYINALNIKRKMENFEPEDTYPRDVIVPTFPGEYEDEDERESWECSIVHESEDAIEDMGELYDSSYLPKEPEKPVFPEYPESCNVEASAVGKKYGIRVLVCGFFGICALPNLFGGDVAGTIGCLILIAICGFFIFDAYRRYSKAKKDDAVILTEMQRQHNEDVETKTRQYEEALKVYKNNLVSHNAKRENLLSEYAEWRKIYIQHLEEEAEIEEKLENDRIAAVNKISSEEYVPALEKLADCNDLVSEEYLPALETIIELLRTNRADNLKEAINLFEEIMYRERQLQLQREQEEQRAYEEELRRQDEERRYQEDKAFREQQERQRQYEERERQRQEERRYQEEMKQREMQEFRREQQEKERLRKENLKQQAELQREKDRLWKAGSAQCRACAYAGRCNMMVHNHAPTCTGFKPR